MTSALTKSTPSLEGMPSEKIELLKRTVAVGVTDDELALFLHIAERTGLDPFARQIHCVKRGNKVNVQTGIDGYRLIADRTGKYAGSDDYRFDEGLDEYAHIQAKRKNPITATVTVYKLVNGTRCPFTATVRWDEYYPGKSQGFMWDKMPYLMLGKTAEALALRKAFPAELSGLYSDEEMAQVGDAPAGVVDAEYTVDEPKRPAIAEGDPRTPLFDEIDILGQNRKGDAWDKGAKGNAVAWASNGTKAALTDLSMEECQKLLEMLKSQPSRGPR